MCNKPPSELTAEFSSGLMTAGNIENQIMFYTTIALRRYQEVRLCDDLLKTLNNQ